MKAFKRPLLLIILLTAGAFSSVLLAQDSLSIQEIAKGASFRGLSAPSAKVCWVSGSKGNVWRTANGGKRWEQIPAPGGDSLDFRDVQAFDKNEAFLMSAGEGAVSRIYHTTDGGQHWQLQFKMDSTKGFLDGMAFWDRLHGIAVGDPVGGALDVLRTDDGGATWQRLPKGSLPPVTKDEYVFAASGTTIEVMGDHVWIGTGGSVARIFRSADRGKSWEVVATPMTHGSQAKGIFSVCFWDEKNGLISGGDYERAGFVSKNLFVTSDGGTTWKAQGTVPYVSCVDAAPVGVVMVGSLMHSFQPLEGGIEGTGSQAGFHVAVISADQGAMFAAGAGGRVGVLVLPRKLVRMAKRLS